ncbi:MAG TPA: response regulator [Burkholderiales bacterium]|jgi:hypothetical protein|nr:response regulator [Burkholderiales bacterium]HEX2650488.1 response regulator [Burkholderiales bacterium]
MQKVKLLLVDDDPRNLIALEGALANGAYELQLAHSGREALELAQKHDFAVILLDVQMPGMDGFEAAKMLRALASCRDCAIIFVTAHFPEEEFVRRGYQVGATDYLVKPLDLEVLRSKVSLYSAFQQKNALLREREQRIRGMEELLRAERNLSAVLETHPIGILVADSDGEVVQINGEVSKVWGQEKEPGAGVHGWWDHDDKLLEAVNALMARVLRTGETSRNEFTRYTRDDGTSKTVLTTASALRNLDGTVVGVVVVIQDLTEHTHIEQDIVQRMYQLASMHPELKQAIRH